jgi:hypothetical protein
MLDRTLLGFSALVIWLVPLSQDPEFRQRRETLSAAASGQKITLPILLGRLGKNCDCVFTIEEAWTDGEASNEMEATFLREPVPLDSPNQVMKQLTKIVPNFTYEVDNIDSRIIRIKDKRLAQVKGYVLDQEMGPFEFQGPLLKLVEAIASTGVPIRPTYGGLIGEEIDRHTKVSVKGSRCRSGRRSPISSRLIKSREDRFCGSPRRS